MISCRGGSFLLSPKWRTSRGDKGFTVRRIDLSAPLRGRGFCKELGLYPGRFGKRKMRAGRPRSPCVFAHAPRLAAQDAALAGEGDGLGAVGGTEFGEDAGEVGFHAGVAETEGSSDFLVGFSLGGQAEDFGFALAE